MHHWFTGYGNVKGCVGKDCMLQRGRVSKGSCVNKQCYPVYLFSIFHIKYSCAGCALIANWIVQTMSLC